MTTIEANTKSAKTEATKASKATKPTKVTAAVKAAKAQREPEKPKTPKQPVDRLPANLDELKASKAGLVCYLFFTGKPKPEIEKELSAAFKLNELQAARIVRRITGRARFFKRMFELITAK